jgi:hypothetical protein
LQSKVGMHKDTTLRLLGTLAIALLSTGCLDAEFDDAGADELAEARGLIVANPGACNRTPKRVVQVASTTALQNALTAAKPGDHIVLAQASYSRSGGFTLTASGTATDPIVIKAATGKTATFTSPLQIEGSRACVARLDFSGALSYLQVGGSDNKILGNRFTGWKGVAARVTEGMRVEIAYNEFHDPAGWTDAEKAGGLPNTPLRMGIRTQHDTADDFHYDGHIHHNWFHDFPTRPIPTDYHSGQPDAIEICETAVPGLATGQDAAGWLVEYNLIERHKGGHGVIDLKCGGITARFNTLLDSPSGRIDSRNGPFSVLSGNWIENAGGMEIHSKGTKVLGNRLINTGMGISLPNGEVEWDKIGVQRIRDSLVSGNNADKMVIGKKYNTNSTLVPVNTTIEAHTGPIQKLSFSGITEKAQASVGVPTAVKLTPAKVGRGALPLP